MDNTLRKEFKYLISLERYARLRRNLEPILSYDENSKQEGYQVRSLYFDTLDNKDMLDTLYGYYEKMKIRLRIYSTKDPWVKLECKRKRGFDTHKISILISVEEAHLMMQGSYAFLMDRSEVEAHELYLSLMKDVYRPKTIVQYHRTAFVHPVSNVRICFDTDIRASMTPFNFFQEDLGFIPLVARDQGVLEVKYDDFLPKLIKDTLTPLDELTNSNSKYVQARML